MKTTIAFINIFFTILAMSGCSRENVKQINFTKHTTKSMEQMLLEAKNQKKILFVDVYASWCGPCKWMDENTFKDAQVSEKFNKTFVNYKIDGESFEGVNVAISYKVDSYPTYLFLNSDGKVLHRIEGSMSADSFLNEINYLTNK